MKKSKFLGLAVTLLAIMATTLYAMEPDKNLVEVERNEVVKEVVDQSSLEVWSKDYVGHFIEEAYNPYYKLNELKLNITESELKDETYTAVVNVSMRKVLKVHSVGELPYVQGMDREVRSLKSVEDRHIAEVIINHRLNELERYMGSEVEQNDTFRLKVSLENGKIVGSSAKLEFLNYMDYIPASYFIPDTEREMMANGEEDLALQIQATKDLETDERVPMAVKYDRFAARDYANTYTSECTNKDGYDMSYWNPKYKKYPGVDCANYVSQCIYAGGIPKDSVWKPESLAWVNTGKSPKYYGLQNYMVDMGYFFKSSKMATSTGGFISSTAYSHVMFVVANDTITMQYSAHTNDRLKHSFANFGNDFEYYYINPAYQRK